MTTILQPDIVVGCLIENCRHALWDAEHLQWIKEQLVHYQGTTWYETEAAAPRSFSTTSMLVQSLAWQHLPRLKNWTSVSRNSLHTTAPPIKPAQPVTNTLRRPEVRADDAEQSSAPGLENGFDRTEENHQIQPGAEVAQVIEVVGELEVEILNAAGVGGADLGPAAQARTHPMALAVVGDMTLQVMLELGTLRPRSDQAHLTVEHIEQLGQLIEAQAAQPPAHRGDALIAGLGPERRSIGRLHRHRAQLEHRERPPQPAAALLAVDHRSPVFQPDQQGRQPNKGGCEQQQGSRHQQVGQTFELGLHAERGGPGQFVVRENGIRQQGGGKPFLLLLKQTDHGHGLHQSRVLHLYSFDQA